VIKAVKYLQQCQVTSYKAALNDAKMNPKRLDDEGNDAAEERF